MNETNPFGVTLEEILDYRSLWRRQLVQHGPTLYILSRPGKDDVSLIDEQWYEVHGLLPALLDEAFKNSQGDAVHAGILLRANLRMRERLAPPGLSKYCLRPEMGYLLQLIEVTEVRADRVAVSGHFLQIDERGVHGPTAVGLNYNMKMLFRAETLEVNHPGIMGRISTLAGMGVSPSELAQQMFRLEAPPAEGLDLPNGLADSIENPGVY